MAFETPHIYSLLLCDGVTYNPQTGGWIVEPFSEVGVTSLPTRLKLTLLAQVMAPPGPYPLHITLYHTADPYSAAYALPPRQVTVHPTKNLDIQLEVEVTLTRLGLYVFEARLGDADVRRTPLRVTAQS